MAASAPARALTSSGEGDGCTRAPARSVDSAVTARGSCSPALCSSAATRGTEASSCSAWATSSSACRTSIAPGVPASAASAADEPLLGVGRGGRHRLQRLRREPRRRLAQRLGRLRRLRPGGRHALLQRRDQLRQPPGEVAQLREGLGLGAERLARPAAQLLDLRQQLALLLLGLGLGVVEALADRERLHHSLLRLGERSRERRDPVVAELGLGEGELALGAADVLVGGDERRAGPPAELLDRHVGSLGGGRLPAGVGHPGAATASTPRQRHPGARGGEGADAADHPPGAEPAAGELLHLLRGGLAGTGVVALRERPLHRVEDEVDLVVGELEVLADAEGVVVVLGRQDEHRLVVGEEAVDRGLVAPVEDVLPVGGVDADDVELDPVLGVEGREGRPQAVLAVGEAAVEVRDLPDQVRRRVGQGRSRGRAEQRHDRRDPRARGPTPCASRRHPAPSRRRRAERPR